MHHQHSQRMEGDGIAQANPFGDFRFGGQTMKSRGREKEGSVEKQQSQEVNDASAGEDLHFTRGSMGAPKLVG